MSHRDLRDWLIQVEEMGELKRVSGATAEEEIGALYEMSERTPKHPTLLFEDIPGYPSGNKLACLGSSTQRICLTMGLPLETNILKTIDMVRCKTEDAKRNPIPPKVVETGPVLENVRTGDDVNLFEFPAPKWHELDVGQYIGTADLVINRDPEENWVNIGTYRCQLHNKNTTGLYVSPSKHARIIRDKYYARNEPCPVVVCFGQDPLLLMTSGQQLPWGVSEFDYAGGIKGEPIEVITGPITGLPIPAHAEVAIEGVMTQGETMLEGPFGEMAGYYASGEREEPIINVKSVMYRDNPIVLGWPPLRPYSTADAWMHITRAGVVWNGLERVGIPGIVGVGCFMEFFYTVVSIKQSYPGHSKQVATVASQIPGGAYSSRWIIVVDDDIDPTNWDDVMWALATRCDPEMSINIQNRCLSTPLDPMAHTGLLPSDELRCFNSRAVIDACIPYELKSRNLFPPVVGTSKELRARVEAKFRDILHG